MPKKLSPLEQIAAGITSNDMSLVQKGYELLTGITLNINKEISLQSTKRTKKAAAKKASVKKSEPKATGKKVPKGPLGLLMDKYNSPDASGTIQVLGNNFVDDRVSCREKVSKDEQEKINKIQGLIGAKTGPAKYKVTCCKCSKVEMVHGALASKSRHYCDKCLASR